MDDFWHALVANFAVVGTVFALWTLAQEWLHRHRRPVRQFALGTFMGLSAIATIVFAVEGQPGLLLDLRSAPLVIAGLFGGPLAALLAAALTAAYRLAVGGVGTGPGLVMIGIVTLLGVILHLMLNGRDPRPIHVLLAATGVAGVTLLTTLSLPTLTDELRFMALPAAGLIFTATVLAGFVVARGEARSAERDLMSAALTRSPEYFYIKDQASRFVMANVNVAHNAGLDRPEDLVGKTDFDLVDQKRADELFEDEQRILRTGTPMIGRKERIVDASGRERWFLTSKVALHNADGEAIGIAGTTRDITEQHKLEVALTDSRNLLNYAVNEMSDGLAMFDRSGHLVYCNERYRGLFPLTADVRRPGAHIRDILTRVVETGEQLNLGDPEIWVEVVAASLRKHSEEQVNLFNGRWLLVKTRPTDEGAAMVVVSDITSIKKAEGELRSLTSELKVLAETDGLTGLMNRRSFDVRFTEALARSREERRPFSLVMFDVDWFKPYNDALGHPAGDECLRDVARCLKATLLRPDDIAARYGGEEFVAILPDTGEDDAFVVADRVRTALSELKLPHPSTRAGIVTISAGIASYGASETRRSVAQLLARADEALYEAKGAGRNRVMGWKPRDVARIAG
ncbi:diguanylate cyclase [Devosia sp. CN2-171]|uniref:diguanylate cyclase n=1 Tax=Devosia sp. CN2-171 TaxID=3400909 RepID=UPI003BF91DC0